MHNFSILPKQLNFTDIWTDMDQAPFNVRLGGEYWVGLSNTLEIDQQYIFHYFRMKHCEAHLMMTSKEIISK